MFNKRGTIFLCIVYKTWGNWRTYHVMFCILFLSCMLSAYIAISYVRTRVLFYNNSGLKQIHFCKITLNWCNLHQFLFCLHLPIVNFSNFMLLSSKTTNARKWVSYKNFQQRFSVKSFRRRSSSLKCTFQSILLCLWATLAVVSLRYIFKGNNIWIVHGHTLF